MTCGGCKSDKAARTRYFFHEGQMVEICDICANVPSVWLPDAYVGKGESEHLADPKTGKPIPYSTKREKAVVMKMLNLHEAGDAKHGSKNALYRSLKKKHFTI